MTQGHRSFRYISLADAPMQPRGSNRPSFAGLATLLSQESAGKAGCPLAPAVRCAKCTRKKNRTAAYRCSQSLGLPCAVVGRLMPCSPGSRVRSGLPRRSNWMMPSARLGSRTSSIRLDRSNDGQDHTVLPYARPAMSPQYFRPCRRSRKLTSETKPSSAVRLHAGYELTGTTRPARPVSCRRCRVHRKPGSRK